MLILNILLHTSITTELNSALLAYADPGSGMLLWQLATGVVIGLLFYGRAALRRIRLALKLREPEAVETGSQTEKDQF